MSSSPEEFDDEKRCSCSDRQGGGLDGDEHRDVDHDEQCNFDDDELWNYVPMKNRNLKQDPTRLNTHRGGDASLHSSAPDFEQMPWKRSRESDSAPQPESTQVPWQRSKGHRPFVDKVTTAELSKKSALAPNRLSGPPAPAPRMIPRITVLAGVALTIVAGVAGFKLGYGPPILLSQPAPLFSQSDQPLLTSKRSLQNAQPDNAPPTKPDSRLVDTRTIATKMKTGVELMTFGEVAAARVMFEGAAEAGEGTGAFKLAETYDPLVLRALRLRERTMPDLALAHAWYEKARELGLLEAEERISRLKQLPH